MTSLQQSVGEYLILRRRLGFKLEHAGHLLPDFATYMEKAGTSTVTIDLALAWAKQPVDGSAVWWQERLSTVRSYVRYLHGIDPSHQIPPDGLLPGGSHRVAPHIYTEAEIFGLMSAAGSFGTDLRAATYTTVIGLLATTGMRSGEAIRLDRSDIDWDEGILFIRLTKFGKSRELVLHSTTVDALRRYEDVRRKWRPRPQTPALFMSVTGARLCTTPSTTRSASSSNAQGWNQNQELDGHAPTISATPSPSTRWSAGIAVASRSTQRCTCSLPT